jgi:UDP-2,3-diacylglucosamine pyrophosphatase LpxH
VLVALLADTHFGVRNHSPLFQRYFETFYEQVFFPALERHGIKRIIHFGDLFDNRKMTALSILNRARVSFLDEVERRGIEMDILIGNHDTFFKNDNSINSVREMCSRYPNIHIYEEPVEVTVGDLKVLYVPWLNPSNMEEGLKTIKASTAKVLMGHLEINGFAMYRGTFCENGLQKELFSKFKAVFSGHFHTRSRNGNIEYLGAPYEMTSQDAADSRGFHIFNTKTLNKRFIENLFQMHYKIVYDDRDILTHAAYNEMDVEQYTDRYVKVVVAHKATPHILDRLLERLYATNPAGVSVLGDYALEASEESDDSGEIKQEQLIPQDTLSMLDNYVNGLEGLAISRDKLRNLLHEIYLEAIHNNDAQD